MILLEKEAWAKECPYKYTNPEFVNACRASECMAWRWLPVENRKQVAPPSDCPNCAGVGGFQDRTGCAECDGEGKQYHFERTGFCGLAGKPEVS